MEAGEASGCLNKATSTSFPRGPRWFGVGLGRGGGATAAPEQRPRSRSDPAHSRGPGKTSNLRDANSACSRRRTAVTPSVPTGRQAAPIYAAAPTRTIPSSFEPWVYHQGPFSAAIYRSSVSEIRQKFEERVQPRTRWNRSRSAFLAERSRVLLAVACSHISSKNPPSEN